MLADWLHVTGVGCWQSSKHKLHGCTNECTFHPSQELLLFDKIGYEQSQGTGKHSFLDFVLLICQSHFRLKLTLMRVLCLYLFIPVVFHLECIWPGSNLGEQFFIRRSALRKCAGSQQKEMFPHAVRLTVCYLPQSACWSSPVLTTNKCNLVLVLLPGLQYLGWKAAVRTSKHKLGDFNGARRHTAIFL